MTDAVIAEDEPVLRAELKEKLEQLWPGLRVVAVAEDGIEALDAIDVNYETLPMVVDPVEAIADGSPLVWPTATGNIAAEIRHGDAADDQALLRAAATARRNPRARRSAAAAPGRR